MATSLDRRTVLRATVAAALAAHVISPATRAAVPDDDRLPLVAGNTAFALDLYRELAQSATGNLIFSPYSVSLALAMTYAGARGDTSTQMAETLGYTRADDAVPAAFGDLNADLLNRGNVEPSAEDRRDGASGSGLRIANALWGERSYAFDDAFTDLLADDFDAPLQLVDFATAPDAARDEINAWVADQTNDRIKDIVPPNAISALTRLVLANAIWFYGAWRDTFEEASTRDEPFHLADGTPIDVPFMVQTESFAYAATNGMQVIDLPYEADGFAMTVILPDDGQFDAVEQSLDPATLEDALATLEYADVRLFMPKFGFDFSASLPDALMALGITDAFDPDRADFSGMTPEPPDPPLYIGDVLHKAFIAVDEQGTEAAAATVVIMEVAAAPPDDEEPIELRLDRPFLFAIRDTDTGSILFLGRLTDPRG